MLKVLDKVMASIEVRKDHYDARPVSLTICLIGFSAHFSFIFLFHSWEQVLLSYFNIFSCSLWFVAAYQAFHGYVYRSVYIASIEILIHAVFAMLVLGYESGFGLHLWPLAAWVAFHPDIRKEFAIFTSFFSVLCAVVGYMFFNHGDSGVSAEIIEKMYHVNVFIAVIAFCFVIVGARLVVDKQKRLLLEQANRDKLTGLYNRHYLNHFIGESKIEDKSEQLAIILTDIDHFKVVNDKYSHKVGDLVLEDFAKCLQKMIRSCDLVCRWGGEEFIIILVDCAVDHAAYKAEEIRRKIADDLLVPGTNDFSTVTASFGVTVIKGGEPFAEAFSRADSLLYKAKESGRNKVVVG